MADVSTSGGSVNGSTAQHDKSMLLAITALGIVFGDIGTSPLYALRECFAGHAALPLTYANILGAVSVMLWTIILIVCVKYVIFVMRADNRGEGGILALIALITGSKSPFSKKHYSLFLFLGILGVALLYSDGIITPAITVLGAVEGLTEITPLFKPFIIPCSLCILVGLFLFQSHGTAKVGRLFGPVLIIWFVTISLLGIGSIIKQPGILAAVNPVYAINFLARNGFNDFAVLGSVFLSVTGAEMLFADMGHFGKKPIRTAWFCLVLPSLILNYFGQGAYLLTMPASAENLFFRIVPQWFLYPMIILSAAAAIIASQAVISGAYSLTRQGVQLGFWPRLLVKHTSSSKIGQVYVPFVNWCLMIGVIILVLVFRKSGNLAAAYGIAVSVDMLISTILITVIARMIWRIPIWAIAAPALLFFCIDSSFLVSNIMKIRYGGWIVLVLAFGLGLLMKTWLDGRAILRKNMLKQSIDLNAFVESIAHNPPIKVPGTAVFLAGNPMGVPNALLHNLKHNKVLHEHTIILSILTEEIPFVAPENRITIEYLGSGMYRIIASYGFSETPNIPILLSKLQFAELKFDPMQTTYFLGRETLVIAPGRKMLPWRKRIFLFMSHNALNATSFFKLPANRVIELGSQVEL
jgi:KUP system potassium uptake protein